HRLQRINVARQCYSPHAQTTATLQCLSAVPLPGCSIGDFSERHSLPWYWARMFSRNRVATGSWCTTMVLVPPPHSVLCKTRFGVAGRFLRLHVPWGGLPQGGTGLGVGPWRARFLA